MSVNNLKDLASTIALISSISCVSLYSANTSDVMRTYDACYKSTINVYGSNTEIPKEYKMKERQFTVEYDAESIFGEMRDATVEEQRNVLKSIKEISEPTGLNFWD